MYEQINKGEEGRGGGGHVSCVVFLGVDFQKNLVNKNWKNVKAKVIIQICGHMKSKIGDLHLLLTVIIFLKNEAVTF